MAYYHNLLNRKKSQLLYTFLQLQTIKPIKGDWIIQVRQDIEDLNLPENTTFYETISTEKFKLLLKSKLQDYAFKKFMKMKLLHSKMKCLNYKSLEIQNYLESKELNIESKKTVLRWRLHMEKFGENFRGGQKLVLCPLCDKHKDTEELSLSSCEVVQRDVKIECDYKDIFKNNINVKTSNTLNQITILRKSLLETTRK